MNRSLHTTISALANAGIDIRISMAHTVRVVCNPMEFDASVTVPSGARVRALLVAAGITEPTAFAAYEAIHYQPTSVRSLSIVDAATAVPQGETVFITGRR